MSKVRTKTGWKAALVAVLLEALGGAPATAAVVRERVVTVDLAGSEGVSEHSRLAVLLETADDVSSWSTYRVVLDDNRTLEHLEAFVEDATGRRRPISASDRKLHEYAGQTIFHSSRRHLLVRYPSLAVGATLVIEQKIAYRPYYPASKIFLGSGAQTERLEVVVTGGTDGWRWHLDGDATGLTVEEVKGGVRITGRDLPAGTILPLARSGAGPVLRFGWQEADTGNDGTWNAVGRWYRSLIDGLPRNGALLKEQVEQLLRGVERPEDQLAAIADFAQDKVRYVAVEVGAGGYRPASSAETLERRWGDCKDKSLLLVELLGAAGFEAYPALLRAGQQEDLDEAFPSPDQFNHMIVVVPAAEGYRFVDPTQRRGGFDWLHPQVQGKTMLLLRPEGAVLARTPLRPSGERRSLTVALALDEAGDAVGSASLTLRGKPAEAMDAETASGGPSVRDEVVRSLFASLLAGAKIGNVTWQPETGPAPVLHLGAELTWPGLAQGGPARRSLALPGMRVAPDPVVLEDRTTDIFLPVRSVDADWEITLPDAWCLGAAVDQGVDNPVGRFQQSVSHDAGRLTVSRTAELRRRHVRVSELPALSALALEEHQAHRRRIRLAPCETTEP